VKFAAAVVAGLMTAAFFSNASAQEPACRVVRAYGASLVQDCGKQLHAFSLSLLEDKLRFPGMMRAISGDVHGRLYFECPVAPMCESEPSVRFVFIDAGRWNKTSKDDQAIYQTLRSTLGRGPPQMFPTPCPVFDVSIGELPGRAVCFDASEVNAGDNAGNVVAVVAADDHVGFLLTFTKSNQSAAELRENVLEMIPRFEIRRASGDSALLEWFR
jgi:hypothetical protein